MGAVVVLVAIVLVGGVALAAGLAKGMAGLLILGIAALAIAGVYGSRGHIPHGGH